MGFYDFLEEFNVSRHIAIFLILFALSIHVQKRYANKHCGQDYSRFLETNICTVLVSACINIYVLFFIKSSDNIPLYIKAYVPLQTVCNSSSTPIWVGDIASRLQLFTLKIMMINIIEPCTYFKFIQNQSSSTGCWGIGELHCCISLIMHLFLLLLPSVHLLQQQALTFLLPISAIILLLIEFVSQIKTHL